MWRFMERFQWAVLGMTCALVLGSGCGGGVKIRAADKMLTANPVKNIAIIGGGKVFYPSHAAGEEGLLCVAQSKECLSILLTQAKEALVQKGYNIVFCEPVGIGYYDPALRENWVCEDVGHSDKRWQPKAGEPGYEYPIVERDPAFRQALRNIFEKINVAVRARTLSSYRPSPSDIAVLQKTTGADTIILERVYGREFTAGRHIGGFLLDVAIGPSSGFEPHESVESFLICVEASTGEVLWQHGLFTNKPPGKPEASFMKQVLEPFPKINEPVNPKYVAR
jgi:hypothetical protein